MIDLDPAHINRIQEILGRHVPEFEIRAFGSRVSGTAKKYSDLDLAIITDSPLSLQKLMLLKEELTESDLPIKVDVLDWASLSPSFRRLIEEKYEVFPTVS
jgi:uncharacterized protein